MVRKEQALGADGSAQIVKYENRRLYDRGLARYITQTAIIDMVRAGTKVTILSKKTGGDITCAVLLACLSMMHDEEPVFEKEYLHSIIKRAHRAQKAA